MPDRAEPSVIDRPSPDSSANGMPRAGIETSSPVRPSLWGVLRHRDYFWVWIGAMGSSIGTWMESVGVQWVVTEQTRAAEWTLAGRPSANLMLGYLAACLLVPMLLLSLPGGVLADRVNRKRLLIVTQFMLMLIAGALMLLSATGLITPTALLLISIAQGTVMAFNVPAWQVLTPRLVPRDELHNAINLNSIQFNIARVVGPALAGVLLHKYGPTVLFAVNLASFLGILAAVARTPDAPAPERASAHPIDEIKEAVRFTFHNRGPFRVFIGMVLFSICAAPVLRMLSLFVVNVYGAEEAAFGTMLSVMGVGAVFGALALKFMPAWYPRHHLIPASILGGGVSITLFAATSHFWLGAVWMFFVGVFWLLSFSVGITALQLLVSDEMRGRAMAVQNAAVFGAMPLGSLVAGLIGDSVEAMNLGSNPKALGVQLGIGLVAFVLVVAGAVMLIWRTPEIDALEPGDPGYDPVPGFWRGLTASAHRPPRSEPEQPPIQEPPTVG